MSKLRTTNFIMLTIAGIVNAFGITVFLMPVKLYDSGIWNYRLLIEQWETKQHQQVHIGQPHMAQMREFKDSYIAKTALGEIAVL